ncbi:arginine--tRNA ligase [Pelagibacteraceae bacterium]|nr:arginine--tRNA ligase [Pelagibacteraceae bacterium]
MNIYHLYLKIIKDLIQKNKDELKIEKLNDFKGILVESPPAEFDFELSCNAALVLAKINKLKPIELGIKLKSLMEKQIGDFYSIELAGPGFLNIKISQNASSKIIKKIFEAKNKYGSSQNNNKKYNIEFVSANPTGPMHVGHCRGAIFGDVLANLLKFNGNDVTKEYYVNDYGNQITNFVKSVFLRIREKKYKEKFINSVNLYPGDYIIDIGNEIIKKSDNSFDDFKESFEYLKKESLNLSMKMIKSDLEKLGIKHDIFFSETELVDNKLVQKSIDVLKKKKYVVEGYLKPPKGEQVKDWKKTKRLIFKSTLEGDDADRALQKNDGTWTYFANDVAYHMDKVSRNYDFLINVLGADHTGYIKRITAAVNVLSSNKVKLYCKVCQLVKLFKNGEPFKMSKRAGDFISANDLLKEVNKDSIRFMMLNRSNDVELDFDFQKVLEKSKENSVFYVQYCYARISSLFRSLDLNINDSIDVNKDINFNEYEKIILRKIFDWPKVVEVASNKCEPHRIPYYLYDLATLFHSYWSKGNTDENYKFIKNGKIKNTDTLVIIKLLANVIRNGMHILGVSLPQKM